MAYTLFYLIGNSDVQINGGQIAENYRTQTQEMFVWMQKTGHNNLKINQEGITIQGSKKCILSTPKENPIIVKTVSFPIFFALFYTLPAKPDKIVLIGTDQKDAKFKKSDTIYSAKLLELVLKMKRIASDVCIETMQENPSDYDASADYFRRFFIRYRDQLQNNIDNYFSLSAGTPAMVQSFALNSLPYPFTYYYVPRNASQKPSEVYLYKIINRKNYATQINTLIDDYHYATAYDIFQNSPFRGNIVLAYLLQAAKARISFDWTGALTTIRNLDKKYHKLFTWVSYILAKNEKYHLLEMYARLEMAFKVKDLQLFLAWLFNLLENLRKIALYQFAHVQIKKISNHFPEWEKFMSESGLFNAEEIKRNYVDRTNIEKALSRIEEKVQTNTWHINLNDSQKDLLSRVVKFLKRIESEKVSVAGASKSMQDLRNEGPFAHGNLGISEENFDNFWPPYGLQGLMQDLKKIISCFAPEPFEENPFTLINERIFKLLKS